MEKIIKILFFIYLFLFPLGVLGKIPFTFKNFPEVNIYIQDLIVGLIATFSLFAFLRKKKEFKLPSLIKPMFVFLGIAGFSLLINILTFPLREIVVGALYWLRMAAFSTGYLALKEINLQRWDKYLLIIGTSIAILGLEQYLLWPDLGVLEYLGWDPHYYRAAGTFLDPNFMGIILVLSLIILLTKWRNNLIYYFLFTIHLAILILTYSRASYLAFGIVFLLICWLKRIRPKQLIIFGFLIVSILALILSHSKEGEGVKLERTSSVISRLGSWKQAILITKNYPLFGVGFNTYRYAIHKEGLSKGEWLISHAGAGVDSSFLFVLATTGLVGLVGYAWFWKGVINWGWKKRSTIRGTIILTSAISLIVHSLFNNTLFYPWIMGWLIFILPKE